jgi:hypothetical protein
MFQNNLKIEERKDRAVRLIFLLAPFLFFLILYNKVSLSLIIGTIILCILYLFFKNYLWVLLVISVPGLIFGKILNISITANWIYEARLAEVLILMSALLFILDILFGDASRKIKINSLSVLLYTYLLFSLYSYQGIVDFRYFIFGLKVATYGFLAYFLALNLINSKKKIIAFLYGLSLTSLILSLQIFFKFYEMGFSSAFFFERSTILIPIGPIATTAAILAFLSPLNLAFYYYLDKTNKFKPFIFLCFAISFLAVFLTLGKGAILSLLIGLFFIFVKLKEKRTSFILFVLLFLSLVYFIFNPFLVGLFERIKYVFIDRNTDFRIKEYTTGWKIIKNNLIFGIGTGQQLSYFKKLLNMETSNLVNNFFLQSMIDLGIIGLSLIFLLLLSIIKKTKKIFKSFLDKSNKNYFLAIGFASSLIIAFLNGLVEVTFFALPYAIIFWLSLGVFENINFNLEDKD